MSTIDELRVLREREDHIEFKRAKHDYPFAGGSKTNIRERRRCVLGYVVALANEKGGRLALGMEDETPHTVVGTDFARDETGNLQSEIYKRLGIRVETEELYDEKNNRVLVLHIPSRPIGKALRFEGVPLMRLGEDLMEMDDATYFNIISEQAPDFSARICEGLKMEDLDETAIVNMRRMIVQKRGRTDILNVTTSQLLSDLQLTAEGKLTYAALVLLGKEETIHRILPQDIVTVEYRMSDSQDRYTARKEFRGPVFIILEEIWNYINQPASNPLQHIEDLPQIVDVQSFNHETIREAILNAILHRSLQMTGDILIKQYPDHISISNPGGFPYGVSIANILTVNSSPRSRLMAEAVEKTGLIERSGQGVDIMFGNNISEGKVIPDYSLSDDYQVTLNIAATVVNPYLFLMIRDYQNSHLGDEHLNAYDLVTLYHIHKRHPDNGFAASIDRLLVAGLIARHPTLRYVMGARFYAHLPQVKNKVVSADDVKSIADLFAESPALSMSDFAGIFEPEKSRKQTRMLIDRCCNSGILESTGIGRATKYLLKIELR